jgi:hypothetical protein
MAKGFESTALARLGRAIGAYTARGLSDSRGASLAEEACQLFEDAQKRLGAKMLMEFNTTMTQRRCVIVSVS